MMKRGIVLLFLACSACLAQNIPSRLDAGFKSIQEETLRADLTFLASDALQGRLSLQPGDEVAVQWIASEFAKAGLKPANNGSYFQQVNLIEYRLTGHVVTWRSGVAELRSSGRRPTPPAHFQPTWM